MTGDSIENTSRYVELSPDRINALWEEGRYSLALGNYDDAIQVFEEAYAVEQARWSKGLLSDAYFSRGEKHLDEGRWEQAIGDFDKAFVGESTDFRVHLCRGRANLAGNRPQEALTDFNNSLLAYPGNPEALALIATAYMDLGAREKAAASLELALSLNPDLKEWPWIMDIVQEELPGYVASEPAKEDSSYLAASTHVLHSRIARSAWENLVLRDKPDVAVTVTEGSLGVVPDPLKDNGRSALKRIGEEVAAARGQRSQRWLADLVGTTEASIRRLERGETNASVLLFARTAKVLGLDVNELLAPIESEEALVNRQYEKHIAYIVERTSAMKLNTETFSVKRDLLRLLDLWPR